MLEWAQSLLPCHLRCWKVHPDHKFHWTYSGIMKLISEQPTLFQFIFTWHHVSQAILETLGQGFSILALLNFEAKWFFVVRGYSIHRRMFSSILAFYLLDASGFPRNCDTRKMSLGITKCPWGEKWSHSWKHTTIHVSVLFNNDKISWVVTDLVSSIGSAANKLCDIGRA